MIYIQTDIQHCLNANGEISYVYPTVRIGLDASDNVDLVKLKNLQDRLTRMLDIELNNCITTT